jgi:hypothetical protein
MTWEAGAVFGPNHSGSTTLLSFEWMLNREAVRWVEACCPLSSMLVGEEEERFSISRTEKVTDFIFTTFLSTGTVYGVLVPLPYSFVELPENKLFTSYSCKNLRKYRDHLTIFVAKYCFCGLRTGFKKKFQ